MHMLCIDYATILAVSLCRLRLLSLLFIGKYAYKVTKFTLGKLVYSLLVTSNSKLHREWLINYYL